MYPRFIFSKAQASGGAAEQAGCASAADRDLSIETIEGLAHSILKVVFQLVPLGKGLKKYHSRQGLQEVFVPRAGKTWRDVCLSADISGGVGNPLLINTDAVAAGMDGKKVDWGEFRRSKLSLEDVCSQPVDEVVWKVGEAAASLAMAGFGASHHIGETPKIELIRYGTLHHSWTVAVLDH